MMRTSTYFLIIYKVYTYNVGTYLRRSLVMQTISRVAYFLPFLFWFLTTDLNIIRRKFDSNFWHYPVTAIGNTQTLKATN